MFPRNISVAVALAALFSLIDSFLTIICVIDKYCILLYCQTRALLRLERTMNLLCH